MQWSIWSNTCENLLSGGSHNRTGQSVIVVEINAINHIVFIKIRYEMSNFT